MVCEPGRRTVRPRASLLTLLLWAGVAVAQTPPPAAAGGIYSCTDARGRRLTSDRPIPECRDREQRLLNRDGSLRAIIAPTPTAEERAAQEARARAAEQVRAAQAEAVRRDRNLLLRYPDEARHQAAREASLDTVRIAIRATELRLQALTEERRPLESEAEFYVGKPLPAKLRSALDANDAAVAAQRSATANQTVELDRINRLYDLELQRLRQLWAGAEPGLAPALPAAGSATAPSSAPARP